MLHSATWFLSTFSYPLGLPYLSKVSSFLVLVLPNCLFTVEHDVNNVLSLAFPHTFFLLYLFTVTLNMARNFKATNMLENKFISIKFVECLLRFFSEIPALPSPIYRRQDRNTNNCNLSLLFFLNVKYILYLLYH